MIVLQNGTTLVIGTAWYNAATIVTVDTTSFSYSEFGNIVFPITVAHGGTGLSSLTAYGLMAAGTTSTGNMQQVTIGAAGTILQSGGSAALPTYTTTTYPSTNAINTIMYASSANVLGVITPVNSAVMVSSGGGVPSMSTTLPAGLTIPGYAASGANSDITSMSGLTGYLQAPLGVKDSSGNIVVSYAHVASAVNYITFSNNSTGNGPFFQAVGSDTNISLLLEGQGTGGAALKGVSTNSDAAAGVVGEFISSVIAAGSAVTATSNAASDITSISLTAGDWDVWANGSMVNGGSVPVVWIQWVSSTSATLPDQSLYSRLSDGVTLVAGVGLPTPYRRFSLATTTNIYLSCYLGNTSGNGTACGGLYARRVR